VVKHFTPNPKLEGSNPATGTGREKKAQVHILLICGKLTHFVEKIVVFIEQIAYHII
jgi:hypothetical protein